MLSACQNASQNEYLYLPVAASTWEVLLTARCLLLRIPHKAMIPYFQLTRVSQLLTVFNN